MAKRIHYFGDINACAKYRHGANMLLNYIDSQDLTYGVFRQNYSDGARVKVNKITPYLQTVDIYAGESKTKKKYEWTLVYAPCPPPDSQLWEGWIECDKEDLIADDWLNAFILLPWAEPLYGDFTTADSVTPVTTNPDDYIQDGGWWVSGWAYSVYNPPYIGPTQHRIGVTRYNMTKVGSACTYTFPNNLVAPTLLENYLISGVKFFTNGGWATEPEGFTYIPLNAYGVVPPPDFDPDVPDPYSPGYTLTHAEGLLSWSSTYMIGFWKWELIAYTPASYLDADNYAMFYDYYESDQYSSTSFLSPGFITIIHSVEQFLTDTHWFSEEQVDEYVAVIGSDGDHVSFPLTYFGSTSYGASYNLYDPDSVNNTGNRASINYETHFIGKYEGVAFDTTIATATWEGTSSIPTGWVGTWSGDNAFAWMARIYNKASLLEGSVGQEKASDHHLLIASWLIGPPDGNVSDTLKVPGLVNGVGINRTIYHARWGDGVNVTKSYSASHPGWHDVYTDDKGNTWRAYGDLFAVLKEVKEEEDLS